MPIVANLSTADYIRENELNIGFALLPLANHVNYIMFFDKSKEVQKLKKELNYFDVFPKVVPANRASTITVKCLENYFKPKDGKINVKVIPMTELIKVFLNPPEAQGYVENGVIQITYHFESEQEYRLKIFLNDDEWALLSVYAVEEDLYELIPLKGETHAHSNISDGWESPEALSAYYRKAGFDFMVISDHRKYEGAHIAREFYSGIDLGLEIVSGEEIHAPKNPVHIVNFGGDFCVTDLIREDESRYFAEVQEIMDTLHTLAFKDDNEKYVYASCLWVYSKIKEANGLSIFAHPHALVNGFDAYNVPDSLMQMKFKNRHFDALELVGGRPPAEINMQLAFYHTACKNGYGDFPIVGGSDSHGVLQEALPISALKKTGVYRPHGFGEFYTIVFAKENATKEIISSIKKGYSVAVEQYKGTAPRVHGDYRLVSYALFLLSEYFPLHHDICYEEGRLMLQMAYGGSESAAVELNAKAGQVTEIVRKYIR